ncbi:MAG: cdx18A [Moraxellaceae bacterium]|jgi:hypothetical protein|nr:cdx18A [Moraxellaceae bacterium]
MLRPLLVLPALLLAACTARENLQPPSPPAAALPAVTDGSLMAPGRPQLAALPATVAPGVQAVGWNMWWGENGHEWVLTVNGQRMKWGLLEAASPKMQQGRVELPLDAPGSYEIRLSLCNDHGCTDSMPALVQVSAG